MPDKGGQALTPLARSSGLPSPGKIVICLLLVAVTAFSQSAEWVAKSEDAKRAMAEGRFKEAVSLYRELVKAFPSNPGLVMNLGLALHSASQYPEAILQFQSALKVQPQLAGAWFLLGVDLQKLNRPSEAVQPLQRALQLNPRNRPAQLELADALLKSGRLSQAAEQFRLLINLDGTNAQAWMGLGIAYSSLAGQMFDRLEKSFGNSAYTYMLVGQARADQLQYRSAYQCFRKALDLNASLTEAHQAIASIYRATGHPDWAAIEEQRSPSASQADCTGSRLSCQFAAKRYEELLLAAKNDRTAESYYWQVRAYTELAEKSQSRLTELPESAEIHQLMATLDDMRGLYLDAIREWKNALTFQPDNKVFKTKLAQSFSSSGEWTATVEIASELVKTDPESVDIRLLLGNALLKMQLPEQAVVHLKKAVTLQPKNLSADAYLAEAYVRLGRSLEAIPYLEASLPVDQDGSLRYRLAQAYRSTGQLEKASAVLAEYARIKKSNEQRDAILNKENEITPPGVPR